MTQGARQAQRAARASGDRDVCTRDSPRGRPQPVELCVRGGTGPAPRLFGQPREAVWGIVADGSKVLLQAPRSAPGGARSHRGERWRAIFSARCPKPRKAKVATYADELPAAIACLTTLAFGLARVGFPWLSGPGKANESQGKPTKAKGRGAAKAENGAAGAAGPRAAPTLPPPAPRPWISTASRGRS